MKKTILAVVMVVMIATPCMADFNLKNELRIENTTWIYGSPEELGPQSFGFAKGKIYQVAIVDGTLLCNPYLINEDETSFYLHFPLNTIAYVRAQEQDLKISIFMYLIPFKHIGWHVTCTNQSPCTSEILERLFSFSPDECIE